MKNRPKQSALGSSTARYERCKSVIDVVTQQSTFAFDHIHNHCADERPAFVTRIVNGLERQGWIVREPSAGDRHYRWNTGRGEFQPTKWLDDRLFGVQVTESPERDRPREYCWLMGAKH